MGVVNVTPDSFYDGGTFLAPERAVEHALQLLDEGVPISSTSVANRRGRERASPARSPSAQHAAVSEEEELRRILPVVEGILRLKRKP